MSFVNPTNPHVPCSHNRSKANSWSKTEEEIMLFHHYKANGPDFSSKVIRKTYGNTYKKFVFMPPPTNYLTRHLI